MFIWAFLMTSMTDPGRVPQYWGYYLDQSEQRNRKYCLTCHTFKPERCHHCSVCNRCVLNMDHHCKWLQVCIGFYNRKYFILLLFYVLLTLLVMVAGSTYTAVIIISKISSDTQKKSLSVADYVILVSYVVMFLLFLVLAKFFYFHVKLCVDNLTTLETLNKERGNMEGYGEYDSGATYNWKQVFGNDAAFWICPFSTESSRPVGDGIVWPKRASTYAANGTNIDLPETMTPYNNKNGEKPSPMANGYNGKSSLPQIPNYSPGGFTQGQAFGTNGMYHKQGFY
eukprot:TRINITY_DN547_c0_g1_i2.p1 TRINITY_DN547_c0_g1~~TRINITY_DN547_c0_g1_i2.p1  ORF type:complete len:283 (-),score=20.82 TRINITY_DN547_c0_g1_i2:141-989(-)